MSHIRLRCTRCGASHAADMDNLWCRECAAPLEVDYLEPPSVQGVGALLHDPGATVSLGEGDTPCVELSESGGRLGLRRLCAKLEFVNPTGSYKDRGTAAVMSVAREHGLKEVVEDSSGNAGASVSAYAARAGIKAHIFAPATAPAAKLRQIGVYGAEVHHIEGTREATTDAALAYYRERRLVYASHALSPYFVEGTATFADEVVEQLADEPPAHIVFPVGNGGLYLGAWKGFRRLLEAGRIREVPQLHCVQASAVTPIIAAYRGEDWAQDPKAGTIAGGISVATPARRGEVVEALRATGGVALAVEDAEILRWRNELAKSEGIFAEPTSAAAFAGLERLVQQGVIAADDPVLVPVTGFGLKDDPQE